MGKLYIVIPAYNEEENIEAVIKDWYPIVEKIGNGSRLVIVDDGSKDATYTLIKQAAEKLEALVPLTKPNGGHGSTILYGYKYALEQGADFIFQTDSDGQTLSSEFWPFWDKREMADMVIGHRKNRQDGISRIFVTKVLKFILFVCFGVWIKDANTPFRLMKAQALSRYINLIPDGYNLTNVIISVIFARKKLKVEYMPITFRPRQGGTNSINMKKIFRIGRQAIRDFREINRLLKDENI
ncbi:glycosyltransferase involved in cell wall biosynthesis [Herbinix hemicellulosilytica]|uniref:Putative membrane protein n=1 Tax=Herbinix hemicellulosilytica TaxID=1564487 RepID=A0A0H5SFG2_HERHM|nr:glycosyltransferase family 2 protein [Herbinix hemicellulosilytica]RBP60041.1 glycosyltransferase involved in cell wall biosynthesis [Herbinix hemicellulosilytica]CRZ33765.1 putative membrane protein [Herbinix hemicellulosilytica]